MSKIRNPARARAVTRAAIKRGEAGLSSKRGRRALAAARAVAGLGLHFTTDEVWVEIGQVPKDHDKASFMGSVMRHLSVSGEIEKTGYFRKSARPEQHCKELRVWKATS